MSSAFQSLRDILFEEVLGIESNLHSVHLIGSLSFKQSSKNWISSARSLQLAHCQLVFMCIPSNGCIIRTFLYLYRRWAHSLAVLNLAVHLLFVYSKCHPRF